MSWSTLFQPRRTINLIVPDYLADPDYLTATQFKGIEGLSCDFECVVTLLSSLPLEVEKWLGQLLAVQIASDTFTSRFFHGMVQRVVQGDYTAASGGDNAKLRQYQLILKPSFSKLKLRRDCRIFQTKNVIDIVKELCHEAFIFDIDTSHLKASNYPKLDYCVQYNETTYDFLHRLLSEAGIYYAYNHSQTQHELVLYPVGSASALPRELLYHKAESWQSLMDSYPNNIPLTGWQGGLTSQGLKAEGATNSLNLKPNDRVVVYGDVLRSNAISDTPPYHVFKVFHEAHSPTPHTATAQTQAPAYRNRFKVMATPFAPPIYPRPRVGGPQSAVVTGPKGRAIYTNKEGMVKVKFPWDRKNPANDTSSKWIPVTQLLSGQGWGTQFIPRVGDEVIVDFIDDDPNQPVVIGSAYNAANPLPFPRMNGKEVQSGYQTFLMGAHGEALETPQTGHTLLFDDTAGQEKIVLKSAGNISLRVHNNLTQAVDGNETVTAGTNIFIQAQKGAATIKAKKIVVNAGASSMILDDSGIHFKPAGKLLLKAKGVGGHYGVARVNDTHDCPNPLHGSGQQVSQGSPTFQIGGQPAARVDDPISCPADNTITSGANNITVDGKPLANANSQTADGGKLTSFAPNVMVADRQPVDIDIPALPGEQPPPKQYFKFLTSYSGIQASLASQAAQPLPVNNVLQYLLPAVLPDNSLTLHANGKPHLITDDLTQYEYYPANGGYLYLGNWNDFFAPPPPNPDATLPLDAITFVQANQPAKPGRLPPGSYDLKNLSDTQVQWLLSQIDTIDPDKAEALWDTTQLLRKDARTLLRGVAFKGKFIIKDYKGKSYVIFKNFSRETKAMLGTRYGIENKKLHVITQQAKLIAGLQGDAQAMQSTLGDVARTPISGTTFVLVDGVDVLDYFTDNKKDFTDLLADLAVDNAKAMLALALTDVLLGIIFTASAPVALLVVGAIAGMYWISKGLNYLDDSYNFKSKVEVLFQRVDTLIQQNSLPNIANGNSNAKTNLPPTQNPYEPNPYAVQLPPLKNVPTSTD